MAECIERAVAVKVVLRERKPTNSVAQNRMLSIIQRDLLTMPAADVVPVVRCKDCKHSTLPSELTQRYGKPGTLTCHNKKYTKDQMAKMVEDAQEKTAALEAEITELKNCIDEKNDLLAEYANLKAAMQRKNVALAEQIDQMNGEAITRENMIANLKADADVLRNKLDATEAALGRANDECAFKQEVLNVMRNRRYNAERRADYAEAHPWRNLWAWVKRKLGGKAWK